MRGRLLDLFCGAGGASIGYARAGWDVTGVDREPQPAYPFTFVQADAMEYLATLVRFRELSGDELPYDAIHASPPCQGYSSHVSSSSSRWAGTLGRDEPRLIAAVRELLRANPAPYVIENVVGARDELRHPLLLCGSMFGVPTPRHRLVEVSWPLSPFDLPRHASCRGMARAYAEARGWDARDMSVTGKGRHAGTSARWREVLRWPDDVPATQHGLREALPPAYTAWLGERIPSWA